MTARRHAGRPPRGGDVVIYREILISRSAFFITAFSVLVLGVGVVYSLGHLDTSTGRLAFWAFAAVGSATLVLGLCFTQLIITLTQRRLILSFGIFRLSLDRREIGAAEKTMISLSDLRGLGIHRGRQGKRFWSTGMGPAVELTMRSGQAAGEEPEKPPRRYVFNSRDPRRLINILDLER